MPPCDVTPRQGVGDLVRGIRTAAAVGDGQTVVDSTRRLCAVVHAQGRVVRDAASFARRWDQTVRSLPAHLQRAVRRAYLAYAELSCKISERDDPSGLIRATGGFLRVDPREGNLKVETLTCFTDLGTSRCIILEIQS